ncbi:putative bifunctional diguanylate cyclase/phosphodiesterase [Caballeronia ptereochthonis]|uniref:Response regulator receiver modulated diguanylate cyclase/phosphodiesterase n=1 Tax=Caballeronia ptereochthonis TaxID=1777144 RepID=A0A158C902_9BURK|nr:EAL domain-containing protein [Caballeronia ptereochthonis]SAK78845.1 response regulator receiver modulated diguanylate cyclase/phosphodiesterase [Caballeronia ptereochthonis]
MTGVYNPLLVCLSLVVAFLASYTAMELSGGLNALASAKRRPAWLAGGAVSMGVGIWSMHFIGMLAFSLPIAVGYDFVITGASLFLAISVSFIALATASQGALSRRRLMVAGTIMGVGVAAMHFTGMHAMQMSPGIEYTLWKLVLSVAVAIVASMAALWLAFTLRAADVENLVVKRLGAAFIMALAITGMHYLGMSAANFAAGSLCLAEAKLDADWLALAVTAMSFIVLVGTLALVGFHTSSLSISLKRANRQLHYLGTHDALTKLPNRQQLSLRIAQAVAECERDESAFAVLFIDLDGFKSINDSLGHGVGDELLQVCAERLRQDLRHTDMVARLGGDEFVIVVENVADASSAVAVANGVLRRLSQEIVVNGLPLRVSASIGIAFHPRDGRNADELLHSADAAMYAAKQSGRNTSRVFEPQMNHTAHKALILQRDLHRALSDAQFSVSFQPKFSVASQSVTGVEALIRWRHPELGEVPPLEFIPIAERSGLIVEIGDWVLREVCRNIALWDARGLPVPCVSVNLSPIQFNVPDLVERIDSLIAAAGVDPCRLMFEITETAAMQNVEKTSLTIEALQSRGYAVAVDDFGTGYSSLGYLQRFRFDQIKIDGSFVRDLDSDGQRGGALLSAVVTLARALQIEVVAEGVETESQMRTLGALACDQMQGYLLSEPMPAAEFVAFLRGAADRIVVAGSVCAAPAG